MSKTLSVSDMLANLEARIAHHRERRETHARQEAHHREQCAFHDAELAKILERYDAFKAAAEAASDYAHPPEPEDLREAEDLPRFGNRPRVSSLITRVVETQPEGEAFGARAIAAEVNRLYGDKLDKPVQPVDASTVLRRLSRARKIRKVRHGKAAHEGLYVRGGE